MSSRNTDDPISSALTSIRRLVRALRLNAQRTQAASGLSAAQLFVLQQLPKDGSLSLNELAAADPDGSQLGRGCGRSTAGAGVGGSRRRRGGSTTGVGPDHAAGRRTLARAPEAPTAALIAALRRLRQGSASALARSLVRLNEALGVADEPATMLFAESDEGSRPRRKRGARSDVRKPVGMNCGPHSHC